MSISTLQNTIQRLESEISRLTGQLSSETKKESDKLQRIHQVERSITKNTSLSTLNSKQNEITRLTKDISDAQAKQSAIRKRITDKQTQLYRAKENLQKEEARERAKVAASEKRRVQEQTRLQRELAQELDNQQERIESFYTPYPHLEALLPAQTVEYDVFISHATEDKEEFVRPLATRLQELGIRVWYDEFTLRIGNNLRRSIDKGLSNSKYGVVVLSPSFFEKEWPQYELDGLVAREMGGKELILPIWHRVTKDEVLARSPSLAMKLARNSSINTIEEIAEEIKAIIDDI